MRGLFIGIGGTGDEILARLKDRVYAACGKEEIPQGLQFRLLDTEDAAYRKDKGARLGDKDADTAIGGNEYLQLEDNPPGTFIQKTKSVDDKPQYHPEVSGWYRADLFNTHLPKADFNLARGAGQHRQIARMGLFLNSSRVRTMLGHALDKCGQGDGELPIWIVGSVAGGTGAGLFLDIALLARLVSEEKNIQYRIIGAAVLPEVFTDVGIDNARAYAALRELERFQAKTPGAYLGRVASKNRVRFSVQYDDATSVSVHLENALFDNLVFYNRKCQNEDDRKSYYSQIADGFNLLLDQAAGDQIFREWINAEEGKATSFNTHRVFVPMQLYARQFILDAARAAADGLLPLKMGTDLVDAGSDDDRRDEAAGILSWELFPLCRILAVDSNNKEKSPQALSGQMDASFIIKNMLGFANPDGIFNPKPTEDQKKAADRLHANIFAGVQTARDTKESFEDSRARVKAEVTRRRDVYERDGKDSFQAALAAIKPMVIAQMESSIDKSVMHYLGNKKEQTLARTLSVLHILQASFNGEIGANLNVIVAYDHKKATQARDRETKALQALDELSRRLLGWRGALADAQDDYLVAVNAVNQQFQRARLVEFLQDLIEVGVKRVAAWIEGLEKWKTAIQDLRKKAEDEGNQINDRLVRQTRVDSVSIGLKNTKDMDGYFAFLQEKCLCDDSRKSFVKDHLLPGLVWQSGGQPQDIALCKWPAREEPVNVRDFPNLLARYLSEKIGQRVKDFEGMARYLRWLRDDKRDRPVNLAITLGWVTKDFLGDNPASNSCKAVLLYGDTWDKNDGDNEFTAIYNALKGNGSLPSIQDNLTDRDGGALFKDRNVLAVLMADNAIPYQQIEVFESMRQAYFKARAEDHPKWSAQTCHLFRCDQEARDIERRQAKKTKNKAFPEIPGELARLLDDPKRSELFGRALVCGVIRLETLSATGGKAWFCGEISEENSNRLIMLNDPEDDQDPRDLLRAFVTFVMDKKDRRSDQRGALDARKIELWIQDALKKGDPKKTIEQMAKEYRQANAQLFDTASLRSGTDETPAIDNNTFLALVLNHYLARLL